MVRPLKFYVVFDEGQVVGVFEGCRAVKAAGHYPFSGHNSRLKAEEIAAWHTFENWKRQKPAELSTGLCERFVMSMF